MIATVPQVQTDGIAPEAATAVYDFSSTYESISASVANNATHTNKSQIYVDLPAFTEAHELVLKCTAQVEGWGSAGDRGQVFAYLARDDGTSLGANGTLPMYLTNCTLKLYGGTAVEPRTVSLTHRITYSPAWGAPRFCLFVQLVNVAFGSTVSIEGRFVPVSLGVEVLKR
jgi:hypothetical protein